MTEQWIIIPRWDEFQHRDMARTEVPPWIKTYTKLLHDDDYLGLTCSQRGLLHGIWLLYASHRRRLSEGRTRVLLSTNKAELAHWTKNLDAIVQAGFITLSASKPASKPASKVASLEVEVEKNSNGKRTDLELEPKDVVESPSTYVVAREQEHDDADLDITWEDQHLPRAQPIPQITGAFNSPDLFKPGVLADKEP